MKQQLLFVAIIALLVLVGGRTWYAMNAHYQKRMKEGSGVSVMQPSTDQKSEISQAQPGTNGSVYVVDNKQSSVTWKGDVANGTKSRSGTISIASGKILADKNGVLDGGMFAFDMGSITERSGDASLVAQLKSQDFFAVDKNPLSTLVIKTIASGGDATHVTVTGDLTINNNTHEVSFPVVVSKTDDTLTAQGSVSFDRTKWGVTFNSGSVYKNLGDKLIGDQVGMSFNLVAVQQK